MNAVCQLFITDKIDTTLCINNYLCFLEGSDKEQQFELILYDDCGNPFRHDTFTLQKNEFETIKLSSGTNTPKIGLATLQSEFGNPYFYTYYSDGKSMAMIHPQMKVPPKQINSVWQSVQTIDTTNLKELRIYQANPLKNEAKLAYCLCDYNSKKVYETKEIIVQAMSANYISFDKFEYQSHELQLWTPQIIAGNGKALIMRKYKSGMWTMNHG